MKIIQFSRSLSAARTVESALSTMSGFGNEAVVADVGSSAARFGFSGQAMPHVLRPSAMGVTSGSSGSPNYHMDLALYQEKMGVEHPVRDGLICDWDAYQALWSHTATALKVDLRETTLLVTEKPYAPPADRIKLAELMFETFQVPSLFLSKDAVLDCYACGRTTGLVIDIGASSTVITPVSDGWVESKGIIRSAVGGRLMDAKMLDLLGKKSLPSTALHPLYRLRAGSSSGGSGAGSAHPTYEAMMRLELARGCKEAVCRMADTSVAENEAKFSSFPNLSYELPDGTVVQVGLDRFLVSEMVCDPSSIASGDFSLADLETLGLNHGRQDAPPCNTETGIPRLICDSTLRCDGEIQHSMTANMVVTGGGSAFEGLPERVKMEVEKIVHASAPTWKIKAVSPAVGERALCAWLGGSILASLGNFGELVMTKAEYNEHGGALVERKCP